MTPFKNKMPKWFFYALALFICAFLMAGCGSSSDGGNDDPAPAEETTGTDTGAGSGTDTDTEPATDTQTQTDTATDTGTATDPNLPGNNGPEGIDDLVGNYTLQDYEIITGIPQLDPITPDSEEFSANGDLTVSPNGDVAIHSAVTTPLTPMEIDLSFHILQRVDATHIDVEGDPVTVDNVTTQCERTVLEIEVGTDAVTLHIPDRFCGLPYSASYFVYQRSASVQTLNKQTDPVANLRKIRSRSELVDFIEDLNDYLETNE